MHISRRSPLIAREPVEAGTSAQSPILQPASPPAPEEIGAGKPRNRRMMAGLILLAVLALIGGLVPILY